MTATMEYRGVEYRLVDPIRVEVLMEEEMLANLYADEIVYGYWGYCVTCPDKLVREERFIMSSNHGMCVDCVEGEIGADHAHMDAEWRLDDYNNKCLP